MTTTATEPQRTPYPPIRELRRSRTDRHLAGVAGGLGRYADVDPLVLRIVFVVLTVFGGSGLLLYALGWLLIPDEGASESEGERLLRGRTTGSHLVTVTLGAVAVIVGFVLVAASVDTGPGLGGLALLVAVALLIGLHLRNGRRPVAEPYASTAADSESSAGSVPFGPPPPPGAPGDYGPGDYGQASGTAYSPPAPPPSPPTAPFGGAGPAPARKPRSRLGRVTTSVALIAVGLMVGWNVLNAPDIPAVVIWGTALAIVAVGLLVSAFAGRARGLIALGVLLSIVTSASAAADDRFAGNVGSRTWRPSDSVAAERPFRLGIGDARLDLRSTAFAPGTTQVQARLGVGGLTVYVPRDVTVVVTGEVGAGSVDLEGRSRNGTDVRLTDTLEPLAPASGSTVTIDAEVGLGYLEVRR